MKTAKFFQIALCLTLSAGLVGLVFGQGSGDLPPVTKGKPTSAPKPKTPVSKPNSGNSATANAGAESKNAPAKPATLAKRPATVAPLTFNQAVVTSLEATNAGRLPTGHYYNEYTLSAKASDLLAIQYQPDSPALSLRIYDAAQAELPIVKDSMTGDYRFDTPTGTVPVDGDYRVRVLNTSEEKKAAGAYTLKIVRSGMTEAAYEAQLQVITAGFKAADATSADAVLKQLELLIAEDPNKPGAFELAGVMHLNFKNDAAKATTFMEQALKLGGAGMFKVTYDSQWRRPKRTGAGMVWEDPKVGWLRIYEGKAVLADINNPNQIISTVLGTQMGRIERLPVAPVLIVQIGPRNNIQFSPASKNNTEADLIARFLQTYVAKRVK